MNHEPVVVDQEAREWEAWPADQVAERGEAAWKTLISAGLTRSEGLTMGVARLPHGGSLHTHRHEQHEVYFVLDGAAVVTIEGTARTVGPGVAVFIPGNAVHSIQATGDSELRFAYVVRGGFVPGGRVRVRRITRRASAFAARWWPCLPGLAVLLTSVTAHRPRPVLSGRAPRDGVPAPVPFRTEHLLGVVVNWPSVGLTDDFARRAGLYTEHRLTGR